jgi:acetyl-CoA carboxylase biotin carboxyl carrier protein
VDLKQIKELMNLMGRTGTSRLAIKQGEFEIELERQGKGRPATEVEYLGDNPMKSELEQHRVHASPSKGNLEEAGPGEDLSVTFATSPMVGTFYRAPSPDDAPFVEVGDKVAEGDVICIIEAMKVMNEVKSDATGTVKKILVENGHPVEFGTKLFEIS